MPNSEVGFPDYSWGPFREHAIIPWEPPIEGEYRHTPEEEEEIPEITKEEYEAWERRSAAEQEAWEMKEARRAELYELYEEAISLGCPPAIADRFLAIWDIAGLRRIINKIQAGEELDIFGTRKKIVDLERQQWLFGEEKAKAKRERLGRIGRGIKKTLLPGGGKTEIYFPGKMPVRPGRPVFGPPTVRTSPAAQSLRPGTALMMGMPLGGLRQAGEFHGTMPHPTGDISGLRMRMGMPKEVVMLKGLTKAENLAYQEIRANGDIDSPAHVASELLELGIPKAEAVKAISGLLAKRLVEKVKDKDFPGEPVLQITEGGKRRK